MNVRVTPLALFLAALTVAAGQSSDQTASAAAVPPAAAPAPANPVVTIPAAPTVTTPLGPEANMTNPMVDTPAKGDGTGVVTVGTTTDAHSTSRADSEVTAALAEGRPKYAPPKASDTNLLVDPNAVDARDINKPKNEIKRLPKYVVRQQAPPIFRTRDLYTKAAQTDLAMKQYAGLGFIPPLSFLNRNVADQMAAEDERLGNISDLKDTAASMGAGGDSAESKFILRETQDTYMRDEGWTWNGPGGGGR